MDDTPPYHAHIHRSIDEVDAAAWDACAGPDNPFVSHAFLQALEASGSATARTGWLGQHLTLRDEAGAIVGAMPVYLKNHSMGEYVFDHAWAEAYQRAGGRYYPKLQASVPFTPATGPRLLVAPGHDADRIGRLLIQAAVTLATDRQVSSLHVTFAPHDETSRMADAGLLIRTDQQFHWLNQDFDDFDAFLASLASRKRKAIRRERQEATADGIHIQLLTGRDIDEAHWDAFFAFYTDTGSRKWGQPYLTRAFFSLIGQTMADNILLVLCHRAGRPIAGALNLLGGDTLYGRYWGCLEDHRFLHFEACYYRAIDYAIANGLARVEAGAQGPHKLARGYVPVRTYSAHWIADPGFRRAVADYLEHEHDQVDREIEILGRYTPFKKQGG